MLIQRIFAIFCPQCREATVLPRRSLLGIFEHPHRQPTDIWPITYLCPDCGFVSEQGAEMIHREGIEIQAQNLSAYKLAYCEFEKEEDGKSMRVFSRLTLSSSREEDFGKLIQLSGTMGGRGLIRHFVVEY